MAQNFTSAHAQLHVYPAVSCSANDLMMMYTKRSRENTTEEKRKMNKTRKLRKLEVKKKKKNNESEQEIAVTVLQEKLAEQSSS